MYGKQNKEITSLIILFLADSSGMTFFAFQGNVNRQISSTLVGSLKGEITQATNGRWVYDNPDIQLKIGDVINYYVFVSVNREGYVKDNLSYTVTGKILQTHMHTHT